MKNATSSLITVVLTIFAMQTPFAYAGDWPQWRGAEGDGSIAAFSEPKKWPKNLTQVWTTTVGEGDSSPAMVNGKLYVFSRQGDLEILRCLDAKNGDEVWKTTQESIEIKGAARAHDGPRSSPAVAMGKVVTIGVAGIVSCYNSENGEVLWKKDEFPGDYLEYFASASPLIVGDICIVQLGGKESGAIIAFDLLDGTEIWRWIGEPAAYASPVLMDYDGQEQIVALTAKNLVGISVADGELLWKTPFTPGRMSMNSATPVVHDDVIIISGQQRGTTANQIKKSDGEYTAVELWKNMDVSTAYNTPVLIDEMLIGISDRKHVYGLDFMSGETLWVDDSRTDTFATITKIGTTLFILPRNGKLTIGKAAPSEYAEVTVYPVSESATYSYPLVSGNRIYIQDQESITAWSIK